MRTYRWDPDLRSIRVFERDHSYSRVLCYGPHTASPFHPYGVAHAILTDFRNRRCAASYWRVFGDEKIAQLNMKMRWELSGEEISAWLGSKETMPAKEKAV